MNTEPTQYVTSTGGTALSIFDRAASYTWRLRRVLEFGEKGRDLRQGKGERGRGRLRAGARILSITGRRFALPAKDHMSGSQAIERGSKRIEAILSRKRDSQLIPPVNFLLK
jgi:hypothetical protein